MSSNKYIQSARLIGSALTRVNPQEDPVLWDILQALRGLIAEFQEDIAQIEERLVQLEAGAWKEE